jgi:hypothetical protein
MVRKRTMECARAVNRQALSTIASLSIVWKLEEIDKDEKNWDGFGDLGLDTEYHLARN